MSNIIRKKKSFTHENYQIWNNKVPLQLLLLLPLLILILLLIIIIIIIIQYSYYYYYTTTTATTNTITTTTTTSTTTTTTTNGYEVMPHKLAIYKTHNLAKSCNNARSYPTKYFTQTMRMFMKWFPW